MNNLRVVFFTNENNFQLAELAVEYLKNHSQNLKIDILSNNFPQNSNFYHSDVEYHNMSVPYRYDGKHFGETMIKYLDRIKEEYIFLFCDDYFVINKVDEKSLESLLNFIKCEDIDYFGFDYMNPGDTQQEEKIYVSKCINENSDNFIVRNRDHRYLYSVQPCIWKKETLSKILTKDISLHNLDNTIEYLRNFENVKALGNSLKSYMTFVSSEIINDIDYFILCYVELVRHGVFMTPENDPLRKEWEIQTKIIRDISNHHYFTNLPFFSKLLNNNQR